MENESTMPPEISGVVSVIVRSSSFFQVFPHDVIANYFGNFVHGCLFSLP